ncbi:Uncharacterised protein [Vibrio cholerae]|nr:Uncharacterised protein [Vibrio cholerae]
MGSLLYTLYTCRIDFRLVHQRVREYQPVIPPRRTKTRFLYLKSVNVFLSNLIPLFVPEGVQESGRSRQKDGNPVFPLLVRFFPPVF